MNRRRTIADAQFGGADSTPSTWWLALSTTLPADDGSGFTEPVGGSYDRVAVPNNLTSFPVAQLTSGQVVKTNGIKLTFPDPTGTWGLISHYGWFLTSSGGVPEWWFPLDTPITPKAGNTPVEFDIGQALIVFAG